MAKNILVVKSSGRKNGNSDMLADAFAKGAEAAGHTVSVFDAAKDRIGGCIGCDMCWSKGTPCVFEDSFNSKLAPLLEKADVIALAGPVYWFTFNTFLKAAIDKLYAYFVPQAQRKLALTESVLLMTAEDTDKNVYNAPRESYQSIAKFNGWTDRGMLLVDSVHKKGDIASTDALVQAEALGKSL